MGSMLSYLRSMKRFTMICFILFRQLMILWPYRLLFAPGAKKEKAVSKYLLPDRPGTSVPEMAKETLEKLGPTYVKFGHFMSIRPDLIPHEFCEEFKKLQDKVPPFPFAQVRMELRRELLKEINEIFCEFDEEPLAAASVSQVHRARLVTGEDVAVKVQRPGIREEMVSDILIMLFFASIAVRIIPSLRKHDPVVLIHEFSRWTDRELYFRQEGKNALHFSYNFKNYPGVKFPKVYREFTTRTVLVMEFIPGVNILHMQDAGVDRKAVANLVVDSMLKQIFIDGFFHGDPHAGNILLIDKGEIAYLDFGIVGYLSEDLRAWIFDILYGMSKGDVTRVIGSFLELCNVKQDEIDMAGYCRQMNEILSELHIYEEAGIPFSQMMKRFLYTSLEFGIRIPNDFVLVTKALTTFEGTCLTLDPDIKIVELMRGFVQKHLTSAVTFDSMLNDLKAVPFELERIKRLLIKHGARAVRFLENPVIRISSDGSGAVSGGPERTGENIAYGFIIAALIVFAALLSNDSSFERWLRSLWQLPDLPILPLVSLGAAGVLCLSLFLKNRLKKSR